MLFSELHFYFRSKFVTPNKDQIVYSCFAFKECDYVSVMKDNLVFLIKTALENKIELRKSMSMMIKDILVSVRIIETRQLIRASRGS